MNIPDRYTGSDEDQNEAAKNVYRHRDRSKGDKWTLKNSPCADDFLRADLTDAASVRGRVYI